ncbi:Hsp20/alpha crystallin family protein [Effusibacillus lacus]|uniref:SHSP domain-containing protein n=1 Tax=Effusibacillus lacus TaxID=1348429 RepID=A0A292YDJ5_9BACL|nr:Hsp20/alpha crystallin family protein [Effusibacillus lacus]TCS72285.1 HSP20 family molecular chaperone IbpA [Effusibacillus lacus]GAX90242.1 hypothetical protein EFBL_1868 [Effusibacillus lacus]
MNNNPMDALRQLGQMGEQLQKIFGDDFIRNLMGSNADLQNLQNLQNLRNLSGMTGLTGIPGMDSNALPGNPLQSMFNWSDGGAYPRTDLYQTRNELIAVLEIPGLEKSGDVKLFVEPNRLVVRGNQSRRYSGVSKEKFLLSERRDSFEREIALPVRVIARKARASYRHGLLEVHMIKDTTQKSEPSGNPVPIEFE